MNIDFVPYHQYVANHFSIVVHLDREDWKKYVTLAKPDPALRNTPFADWNTGLNIFPGNCFTFISDIFPPDLTQYLGSEWGGEAERVFIYRIQRIGLLGKKPMFRFKPEDVHAGLLDDGFLYAGRRMPSPERIPQGYYLTAAYCYGNRFDREDDHFYRYVPELGLWFHKAGYSGPVKSTDDKGQKIINLKMAERSGFDEFVGYFLSPPNRPRGEIMIVDQFGKPFSCPMPRPVHSEQRQQSL